MKSLQVQAAQHIDRLWTVAFIQILHTSAYFQRSIMNDNVLHPTFTHTGKNHGKILGRFCIFPFFSMILPSAVLLNIPHACTGIQTTKNYKGAYSNHTDQAWEGETSHAQRKGHQI